MHRYIKSLAIAAAVVAASTAQVAQAKRDFAQIYVECGLGGLIFTSTGWAAVTSNIIWDLGTTAVISESSSPETCKGGHEKTAMMIYEAYPSIETELAQGRGEHLDALLALAGREQDEHVALIAALRDSFGEAVAEPGFTERSRYEKAHRLYDELHDLLEAATPSS